MSSQGPFFSFSFFFYFGEGTLLCYPKCSYSGEENPTSMIWEGMEDVHYQSPLGWGGWFFWEWGGGNKSCSVLLGTPPPLHLSWILAASL